MEDVLADGTGSAAAFEGTMLAGKSGTTNDIRDAWFVGFSPSYHCGVWGGFDSHAAQESSRYVQQIWKAVMKEASASEDAGTFVQASDLVAANICRKCGKLAVDGLCDHTVQGDVTGVELFAPGTAPTERCDCHVSVTVCDTSGQKAGSYCTSTTEKVYLKSASADTTDAQYVMPAGLDGATCQTHRHFWNNWSGSSDSRDDEGYSRDDGGYSRNQGREDDDSPWWKRIFGF